MSVIYVLAADGSHAPCDESQALSMLNQGLLNPETFYWREGMPEWRPLKELAPPNLTTIAPPGSLPVSNATGPYTLTKKIEPLATIVKVLIVVTLVIAMINLFIGITVGMHTAERNFLAIQKDAHWMTIAGYSSLAILLVTSVPFLMWIYRVSRNCRRFVPDMQYSSGLAAGGYFIPFANLVYPCVTMQEIWKVSRNPANWHSEKASFLVGFWWGFWLLTGILGQVLSFASKRHAGTALPALTAKLEGISLSYIALETSKIIVCLLAFAMVHIITQNQKQLTQQSGA